MIDLRGKLPTRPGRAYYHRDLAGITGITVHYTASPARAGLDAVRAIAKYQVGPNAQEAFPGIAYTMVVDSEGTIYQCWDLDVRCWHSGAVVGGVARNASHVGIAIINDTDPSMDQLNGLADAIQLCEYQLDRPLTVEGHKDAPYPTACPGAHWQDWKPALMTLVNIR